MHRLNRFAHALHEPVVVGERAIHFGKRSCGQDDVGLAYELADFRNEKLPQHHEVAIRLHVAGIAADVWQHRITRHDQCAISFVIQYVANIFRFVATHVVRADAVVEERQRMQQNATALAAQRKGELRDDRLRCRTQFPTEHDHDVARRLIDRLAQRCEFALVDPHLLRG